MKKTKVTKLMDYLFGIDNWDNTSLACGYWTNYINRQKTTLKNLKRRAKKLLNNCEK